MKKASKSAPVESVAAPVAESAPLTPVKHTRVIRAVIPYTDEMMVALEDRLDAIVSDGFEVVTCVPYGVDHVVILLKRTAA